MYDVKHIAKIVVPAVCFMALLLSMTACGVSPGAATETASAAVTATGEIRSKKIETQQNGAKKSSSTAVQISEDDAKSIALEHAGVSDSDVTFIKSELERDNGRTVYEIEFRSGGVEYEYEVHSETGEILKSGWERR